jgi:hypothetical protein
MTVKDPHVTEGKSGAKTTCPASKPCTLALLSVSATAVTLQPDEVVKLRRIDVKEKKRGNGVTPGKHVTRDVRGLLDANDLVIDTVADYHEMKADLKDEAPMNPNQQVKLAAKCKLDAGCPLDLHPIIFISPEAGSMFWGYVRLSNEFLQKEQQESHGTTDVGPRMFTANSAPYDGTGAGDDLRVVFDFLTSIWPATHPKQIKVHAHSCGWGPAGGTHKDFIGLVRIFRNDKWSVNIVTPPLLGFSKSWTQTRDALTGKKDTTVATSSVVGFGHVRRADSTHTSQELGLRTEDKSNMQVHGHSGSAVATQEVHEGDEYEGGRFHYAKNAMRRSRGGEHHYAPVHIGAATAGEAQLPPGFTVTFSRNGHTLPLEKLQSLIHAILKFREKIVELLDGMKFEVQLGFGYSYDVKAFYGTISGSWWPTMLDAREADDRYLPVGWGGGLEFALTFIDISLTGFFGIDIGVKVIQTGVSLKIQGTIALKVDLKMAIDNIIDFPDHDLKATPTFTLAAVAFVNLFGYHLVDGIIALTGGFPFSGKIVRRKAGGIGIVGTMRRSPTQIVGGIILPWWQAASCALDPITLIEGDSNLFVWNDD